jgi:hypothetical protein
MLFLSFHFISLICKQEKIKEKETRKIDFKGFILLYQEEGEIK